MQTREARLQSIRFTPEVSVLIIGAGINGIGTFRDLALQGIDVVMVDRGDYCSGASAASSHMIHGGIRYLENGEFRLVREAVQERNRLIENAPHLATPLPTTFPIFKMLSGLLNAPFKFLGLLDRPSERGAVVIKVGMTLYDFFSRKQKTVPLHVFRNKTESLALFPSLNREVIFTGTYYDGAMLSPERIAMELIQDAVNENEMAIPLNYVGLVSANGNEVSLIDEVSGERIQIKPKVLINAAGPWIDLVNEAMGKRTTFVTGTKGSHLILDHPELRSAIGDNEFLFENNDGRIVLIFPLDDKVLIGTSDIRVDHPDGMTITEGEIDYFFEMLKRVFPTIEVNRSHIVYTFSGVRPLLYSEAGPTGQISREHKVQRLESGDPLDIPVLSLVGGKWTSFRAFAEITTNEVVSRLDKERQIGTEDLPIGGGRGYPETEVDRQELFAAWQETYGCTPKRAEILLERYGTRAEELLKSIDPANDRPFKEYPDFSHGEIQFLIEHEDVVHLDDLVLRRTQLGKLGLLTEPGLNEIAEIAAEVLNWTPQRMGEEIQRFRSILRSDHRVELNRYLHVQQDVYEEVNKTE